MRVLVVEDDDSIAEPLVTGLERESFVVERVATGAAALAAAPSDMVLLDLGLPDIDGYEVCRRLRAVSDVPIIVVTARGQEVDRVVGLELGADDYLVKPFGLRELVARIRAVARRSETRLVAPDQRRVGVVELDVRTRRVTVDGPEVELTRKEFDLLATLIRTPGRVFGREELLDLVWGQDGFVEPRTVDVHVARLRAKFTAARALMPAIETVRGVGYRFRDPGGP